MSKTKPPYPAAFGEQIVELARAGKSTSAPTLECALIARRTCKSKAQARTAVFTWIEGWYNPRRRHSALDHQSPMNFERNRNERERVMQPSRPEHGLTTASIGSSQAPTDTVDNPAASTIHA